MTSSSINPNYESAVTLARLGSDEERSKAIELIVATHWKSLYKYLRIRDEVTSSDAESILLSYLGQIRKKGFFDTFETSKLPIRTFLRKELDQYAAKISAQSNVNPAPPMDFSLAEEELRTEQRDSSQGIEEYYESEWLRNIFTLAVEELYGRLQTEGKTVHFFLFLKHDLQGSGDSERVQLEDLARELTVPKELATSYLQETRKIYQTIVTDLLRSLTTSEEEFQKESRLLFGSDRRQA